MATIEKTDDIRHSEKVIISGHPVITEEDKAFYQKNGYLVKPDVIDPTYLELLRKSAEENANSRYTVMLDMHLKSEYFKGMMTDPTLLKLVDTLQDARMIPIGSVFFFCKPENPADNGSQPHQDNYAPKSPFGSYIVFAVALDDATPENGSLIVYPGTHLLGDLPATTNTNFVYDKDGEILSLNPIGNKVQIPEGYKPVQLEYTAGSIIFMHAHTIHEAPKNPSTTNWRRKIYMHYIKDGHPFWPGWSARRQLIDRGDFHDRCSG